MIFWIGRGWVSDVSIFLRLGLEYVKARQLALRRAYPDQFKGDANDFDEDDFSAHHAKVPRPLSAPASPRFRSGAMTPGDMGSLQEGGQELSTDDYITYRGVPEEDANEDSLQSKLISLSLEGAFRRQKNAGLARGGSPTDSINGDADSDA